MVEFEVSEPLAGEPIFAAEQPSRVKHPAPFPEELPRPIEHGIARKQWSLIKSPHFGAVRGRRTRFDSTAKRPDSLPTARSAKHRISI
jgi:hypothetical protein